jgi:predicted RND superfamily exporter protein
MSASEKKDSIARRLVFASVDFGGRHPLVVIGCALMLLLSFWSYARRLEVRSDVMELLPRDSPGFRAFEQRLERVGGRSTIVVVCESPERKANERFIDELATALDRQLPRERVAFIESGTKDVRAFFESNKWLYVDVKELEEADATLDRQIAIASGMVDDLESDEKPAFSLGMEEYRKRWKQRADEKDDFPTGYFASPDGTQHALRIFSTSAGMGGGKDEEFLAQVKDVVERQLRPSSFHPLMKVGYGGDIPNAAAEKESLVSEAVVATSIAVVLILAGIVIFYRSFWAIPLIFFPPLFGVGCAYAFATYHYGYVNASGAFLGAIILGNGVNYPIVLYSRYREFRARGMSPDDARREAVWNAFRAELVGSSVASIAYGSLTVTNFRGFNQFGVIGFVGMLLVWISMIPCLPALVVLVERLQARLPAFLREAPPRLDADQSRGLVSRVVGDATRRWPHVFVGAAVLLTVVTAWRLPGFLRDPWEYDFDKLGSKGSRLSGAAQWSAKGDKILSGRINLAGALVLAEKPEQVPFLKARILENDAADPAGSMIEGVTTVSDFLPGTTVAQSAKLAVLTRLRERITPTVLSRLSEDEATNLKAMIPPETLAALTVEQLPPLLRHNFSERNGVIGTVFYVRYRSGISNNDGHNLLRMSRGLDGLVLPDGTRVDTASRATVFAEMIKSLERDGPLATGVSFLGVLVVVLLATSSKRGSFAVVLSLVLGVVWTLGIAAFVGERLNFLNFIALPITFGIGSEYPFNIYDRSRLLGGDVTSAVKLHFGAVALCSYTTVIGYGSLLFADNQALRSFGRLATSGEIACVIAALLFLPSLLHLLDGWRRPGARRSSNPPDQDSAGVSPLGAPGDRQVP